MPLPLMVRNNLSGPTVLVKKDKYDFRWAAAGDPMGGDVQRVSADVIDDIDFLRALDQDIFAIEEAPEEIEATLAKQSEAYKARLAARTQAATEAIQREQANDLVSSPCIGPNPTGRGECGSPVVTRERDLGKKPPLCPTHDSLSGQFISTEDMNAPKVGDAKVVKWVRVTSGSEQL